MLQDFLYLYALVCGFCVAGLVTGAFEYATDRPLGFEPAPDAGVAESLIGFILRIVAGPYLIAHALWMARRADGEGPDDILVRHRVVLFGLVFLVAGWSLAVGIVVLESLAMLQS